MSLDIHLSKSVMLDKNTPYAVELYSANITHNLGKMANEAGIYVYLWRPDENNITIAEQLIEPLEKAIAEMKADPDRFKRLDSPNGWGKYVDFLPWLEQLLSACRKFPFASIEVSR